MELNEWAKLVLFEPDLQVKMQDPGQLHDDINNDFKGLDFLPHRSPDIAFRKDDSANIEKDFHNPEYRALLLHTFANHELLALEALALAILKFPDAPPLFRKGLAATMRDEQRHFKMYEKRLDALGVKFGEYPLNSFIWRTLAQCETVGEFVSLMNLTFEQANLDHCLYFGNELRKAGDPDSGKILQDIYQDEIGHVHFGVRWLPKVCQSDMHLWDLYFANLRPPMNPARAKGAVFDLSGRQKAGLDQTFIEKVKLYNQSKGRLPVLYYWNQKNTKLDNVTNAKVANSLEHLFLYCAEPSDAVLLTKPLPPIFVEKIARYGLALPETLSLDTSSKLESKRFTKIEFYDGHYADVPILRNVIELRNFEIKEEPQTFEAPLGKADDSQHTCQVWPSKQSFEQVEITSLDQLEDQLSKSRDRNWRLKGSFASSGHDSLTGNLMDHLNRAKGILDRNQSALLEADHHRVCDFSVIFDMSKPPGKAYQAFLRQICDAKGKFHGFWDLNSPFDDLDSKTSAHLLSQERIDFFRRLRAHSDNLFAKIGQQGYQGKGSLDGYVFSESGEIMVRPVCEINRRWTMGHVFWRLRHRLHKAGLLSAHQTSAWLFFTKPEIKKYGYQTWTQFESFLHETFQTFDFSPEDDQTFMKTYWIQSQNLTNEIRCIPWLQRKCYPLDSSH